MGVRQHVRREIHVDPVGAAAQVQVVDLGVEAGEGPRVVSHEGPMWSTGSFNCLMAPAAFNLPFSILVLPQ